MKVAVVLENRDEDFEQMEKLIYAYESSIVIQRFETVDAFAIWFRDLAKKPPEDAFELLVLISNYQILGAKHISLFQKINSFMKDKGYLGEGIERMPLIITARDIEGFESHQYQLPLFDNIIFKPLDLSVGKGKLDWAIQGVNAMNNEELQKQKPVTPLEMLKNVQVDRITELGFRSISMKPIAPGRVAKYYIPSLKPLGENYGVYASCSFCTPIGEHKNKYACSFSFFGLTDEKARNIRKLIESASENTKLEFASRPSEIPVGIVTISEESDLSSRLEGALDAAFKNIELKQFENFMDFYSEIDASQAAKIWLAEFKNVTPAVVEFDQGSGVFTRVFKKGDEKTVYPDYLGLNEGQFKRFKTLCLANCRAEMRKNLGQFWNGHVGSPLSLLIRDQKRTCFLTFTGSQIVDAKEGGKKLQIEIRPATPEEIVEIKKHDRQIPQDLRMVIITERIAQLRPKEFWEELRKKANPKRNPIDVPFIIIGKREFQLFDQAQERDCFTDYLVEPFDQIYLKKRANYLIPELVGAEGNPTRSVLKVNELIKAGTQVEIKNFSEVSLSVEYHRQIPQDTFREFVIFIQQERLFEELLAKCVGSRAG